MPVQLGLHARQRGRSSRQHRQARWQHAVSQAHLPGAVVLAALHRRERRAQRRSARSGLHARGVSTLHVCRHVSQPRLKGRHLDARLRLRRLAGAGCVLLCL
jgi:hypothetical protein